MTSSVFLLGLGLGFFVGYVADDLFERFRASRKGTAMEAAKGGRRRSLAVVLFVMVVVVQAAVGFLLILQRQAYSDYVTCKAEYDQQAQAASGARLKVAEDVDSAMDDLLAAVASQDQKAFREALVAYQELRDTQQRQRSSLPKTPEQVCGAPGDISGADEP